MATTSGPAPLLAPGRGGAAIGLTVLGIAALGVVLRSPIVALAPLAPEARADLGVGAGEYGLLTSIPVLCFAVASPLALAVLRRAGLRRGAVLCATGIALAVAVRAVGGLGLALLATVALGVAMTLGNVLVPALVRRDVPARRRAIVTAVFTFALNAGSVVAAVASAPLAVAVGWRGASALFAVLAAAVAVFWILRPRDPAPGAVGGTRPPRTVPRTVAVLLAVAFCGQAFCFYGFSSWLPTLLHDFSGVAVAAAAPTASLFQAAGLAGCIAVPALGMRLRTWQVTLVVGLCWIALPIGLLAGASVVPLLLVGGVAQGAGLTAVLSAVATLGATPGETARLSAFVQGAGYAAAAIGPTLLGWLRDTTGTWAPAIVVLAVGTVVYLAAGTIGAAIGARDRMPA
jgi:CP family cyanate transporter-like MFS transporter